MPNRKLQHAASRCLVEALEQRQLLSGVVYGANLILNPSAENYDGTADGFNIITPRNWIASSDPTVAQYRSGYGAAIGIRKPDNAGNAFFTGGPDSETTDFLQLIDLSSIASTVDAGQVNFSLSAELGGDSLNDDNANVLIKFEDASGAQLSRPQTGSVSASDRDYESKFLSRSVNGIVPATTRFAQVDIHFKRDGVGGYNNGFADNVSLVLVTNTASTAGITPSVVKSTLPTTAISGTKTNGALFLTLTNTSSSVNRGLNTISLFASNNGVVDSTSIPLATLKRSLSFGAGKSTRLTFPLKTFAIPAGIYTIFAQTTDKYLTTVTAATGPTIVIAAPMVTLSSTIGAVKPPAVTAGKTISFTLTLQNTGNVDSTGLANLSIGLSPDGITLPTPLTTSAKHMTVKASGRLLQIHLRLKVPAAQVPGTYNPFVVFTQGANSATAIGSAAFTVRT
jgi:hypothetical protein